MRAPSAKRPMRKGRAAAVALGLSVLSTAGVGCPCTDSVVNSSPWLRWKIFAMFGAGQLCSEMMKRGAPLRMADGAPIIGRFYPSSCQSQTNDDRQTVTLQFAGDGYAWTPITRRMSFSTMGVVEYKPDFHKDGGTVYVWFRPLGVPAPTFNVGMVEQPVVGLATSMTPLGTFVNLFGTQVVSGEMGRGFTVIHEDAGDDFSLGILQPGQRPSHPYDVHGDDRYVFANESSEVHANMLDFVGPFEIDSAGRSLFLKIRSSGVPLDVAIVPRDMGEAWRRQYQNAPGIPMPPSPPIVAGPIPADTDVSRSVPLPKGQYYVVLDNSPYIGQVAPPTTLPLLDPVARVSLLAWMADTP